jgi:uncharacterized protein DUF4845
MRTRSAQSGITILGFIFVATVVLCVVMIGFRVLPSYIEYFAVVKTLKQTLDTAPEGVTQTQFRNAFDLRAGTDYIDSVTGADVDFTKQDNALVASVAWTKTLPLVGNVSLLLDFQATASK